MMGSLDTRATDPVPAETGSPEESAAPGSADESAAPGSAHAATDSPEESAAIALDEVLVDYGSTVVGPVTASFARGRVTALTGASGSGKTSLCLAMTGFLEPTSGTVEGERGVLIPQNPREWLNPRHTVAALLEHTARIARGRKRAALPTAERTAILEQALLPVEMLESRCGELSGGQAARVCLARALASGAEVIVCDEPTAALDASNAARFARLIGRLAEEGRTIVWATHDLPLVRATNPECELVALD